VRWLGELPPVYVHRAPVDFRKAVNGLSVIVEQEMSLSPYDEKLFVFCNKAKDHIKILYWDKTGFALWYKRLEADKFKWPSRGDDMTMTVSAHQLSCLLSGLSIEPHRALFYREVS
jgi:transposase